MPGKSTPPKPAPPVRITNVRNPADYLRAPPTAPPRK